MMKKNEEETEREKLGKVKEDGSEYNVHDTKNDARH